MGSVPAGRCCKHGAHGSSNSRNLNGAINRQLIRIMVFQYPFFKKNSKDKNKYKEGKTTLAERSFDLRTSGELWAHQHASTAPLCSTQPRHRSYKPNANIQVEIMLVWALYHTEKPHRVVILAQGCSTCDGIDGDRTMDCWNRDNRSVGIANHLSCLCGAIG